MCIKQRREWDVALTCEDGYDADDSPLCLPLSTSCEEATETFKTVVADTGCWYLEA
jgi:hypothetical protein